MRDQDGVELVLIRFLDGPAEGSTFVARTDRLNGWPPPERLAARFEEESTEFTPLPSLVTEAALEALGAKAYERVAFSPLPAEVADSPYAARNAEYRLERETAPSPQQGRGRFAPQRPGRWAPRRRLIPILAGRGK